MENHTPKYHEVVKPVKELAQQLGNFVMDRVLGADLFSDMLNGPDNSPLDEASIIEAVAREKENGE